jgi:3'(2'), 5'-bisphosphate nucleotidase
MDDSIISGLVELIRRAGEEVLEVYDAADIGLEHKDDKTPLTEADRRSDAVITEGLKALTPDIPVISEESRSIPHEERKDWERFWLVDPLDGTKEFVSRNGEFTLNIALIEGGSPAFGMVGVPVKGMIYYGSTDKGAFGLPAGGGEKERISVKGRRRGEKLVAVASRSHLKEETKEMIKALDGEMVNAGSSLKFVLVAKGEADLYPRLGTVHEWDAAAGHAVAEAAGAVVCGLDGKPLVYNKETFKHDGFLVCAPEIKDRVIEAIKRVQ